MIETINYIAKNGIIINGMIEGRDYEIKFSDINSFWDCATEEDFEGGTAKAIGEKILFTMLTGSGQGGVVVLWDIKNKEVEHISECSYSVAVDIYDNVIYSLHCVYNYNTKAHFRLYKIICGITDAFYEGDQIEVEFPDVIDEYNGDYNNIDLSVVESTFIMTINGKEYKLKHRDC